jgi:uncharacterized protein
MNIADELQKLAALHQAGTLSTPEFEAAKARLLQPAGAPPPMPPEQPPAYAAPQPAYMTPQPAVSAAPAKDLEAETRQWAMWLHLSQLLSFVVPLGGLVAPIVIWQMKKKELPGIDIHGVHAVNWIITAVIIGIICIPLVFVLIGIPMLIALGIVSIVFPILGGIKANNGEVWRYPMSFSFLKPQPAPGSQWPGQ